MPRSCQSGRVEATHHAGRIGFLLLSQFAVDAFELSSALTEQMQQRRIEVAGRLFEHDLQGPLVRQ